VRRLPKFEYFKPKSFEDAIQLLKKYDGKIKSIAGGTDVIVAMKEKGLNPGNIMDLKGIEGYDYIREFNNKIEIGALSSIRSIELSSLIRKKIPFLSEAAGKIGSVQVRNKATLGGNLCNASPSADTAPPLICLKAELEIIEEQGIRTISIEDFFTGPGETILKGSRLMMRILVPLLPENCSGVYFKYSPRRAMDLAVIGMCCVLMLDDSKKKCLDARIALGAVAPIPLRAKKAESLLRGKEITDEDILRAGEMASEEIKPITDVRGSAEYRTEIVKVFVRRGIREILDAIRAI